eukprot:c959_g1_i1 orf=41-724(+)
MASLSLSFTSPRLLCAFHHAHAQAPHSSPVSGGGFSFYVGSKVSGFRRFYSGSQRDALRLFAVHASLFAFLKKDRQVLKQELLDAIAPLDRGAAASAEELFRVDKIARELEAVNPNKEPLKSVLLNGKWELLYTTSSTILKKQWPKVLRPGGSIFQAINADTLRAQNLETWPYFNQVTANLTPLSGRKVAVKFDNFKIGSLSFKGKQGKPVCVKDGGSHVQGSCLMS